MLEVVEQRDSLVALLEEQRLREKEEDKDLEAVMLTKGFNLNWAQHNNGETLLTASDSQFHYRECKESVCLPLRFIGHVNNVYKSTHEHEDDVYEFSWHDSGRFVPRQPRQWFCPRRSHSECENALIYRFFFFGLEKEISILLMLRKSETIDPTKSQSCFSENKLLCFHGGETFGLDLTKMCFLP